MEVTLGPDVGPAATLSPIWDYPSGLDGAQPATARLAKLLTEVSSGVRVGAVRARLDTVTDYTASASFTVTGANIAAAETITFNVFGQLFTITAVASGAASGDGTFNTSGVDNTVATNIRAAINSRPGLREVLVASGSTNTVTITAAKGGTDGNSIIIKDGTTNGTSLSGGQTTLSGGLDPSSRVTSALALTFANIDADETMGIGGVTLTWKASAANEDQVTIGANLAAAGANLTAAINVHSKLAGLVSAAYSSGTVTLTWLVDPRVAMLMLMASSDATAVAVTQPSLASRTAASVESVVAWNRGAP
jgi:hypothetical protein